MSNETKAQCPDGYDLTTVTLTINGCDYSVDICHQCIVVTPPPKVMVYAYTKINPNCQQSWNSNQVLQAIYNTVYNLNFINTYLCAPDVPPCDQPPFGKLEAFVQTVCWHKIRTSPESIRYEACAGSSSCTTVWRICWDYLTGMEQRTLIFGPMLNVPSFCPTGPEPPDPEIIGQSSECFSQPTLCD